MNDDERRRHSINDEDSVIWNRIDESGDGVATNGTTSTWRNEWSDAQTREENHANNGSHPGGRAEGTASDGLRESIVPFDLIFNP